MCTDDYSKPNAGVAPKTSPYNPMQQWLDEKIGQAPWSCVAYHAKENGKGSLEKEVGTETGLEVGRTVTEEFLPRL